MRPVLDLTECRSAALHRNLEATLLRDGSASRAVADLGLVTPEQWQRAAHGAATITNRPVVTGLARERTVVWAAIADWPRTVEEQLRAGQLTQSRHPTEILPPRVASRP